MESIWKCKKCGSINDPEVYDNVQWRCTKCRAMRRPWIIWLMIPVAVILSIIPVLIAIPELRFYFSVSRNKNETTTYKNQTPEKESGFIHAEFQFQKQGNSEPSRFLALDSKELRNLALSTQDNYRLSITPSHDRTYLYIFQLDLLGNLYRVFPHPVFSQENNPIHADQRYQIPPGKNDWLHFNTLQTDHSSITETLHILATDHQLEKLERLYTIIHISKNKKERNELLQQFQEEIDKISEQKGLVYCQSLSIDHVRPEAGS